VDAIDFVDIVDRAEVGMVDGGGQPCLALEALQDRGACQA
jgi:hypothetical protein